jgi:hypothetical protein
MVGTKEFITLPISNELTAPKLGVSHAASLRRRSIGVCAQET